MERQKGATNKPFNMFQQLNLKTIQWFKKKTAKWFNNRRYSKTLKLFDSKNTQIGEAVRMLQLDSLVKSSSTHWTLMFRSLWCSISHGLNQPSVARSRRHGHGRRRREARDASHTSPASSSARRYFRGLGNSRIR